MCLDSRVALLLLRRGGTLCSGQLFAKHGDFLNVSSLALPSIVLGSLGLECHKLVLGLELGFGRFLGLARR